MDHFRQQLQLLILGKGLTRKELSRKLNRHQNTIQQWITKDNINQAQVKELCKFFNIDEKELMGDPEELTDYRFFDQGKYICTAPLKELSKITGKDVSMLKYYIHLNEQGREAGQYRIERVIEYEK
jgi:transcriptional regulator with XRE-family HTH domain